MSGEGPAFSILLPVYRPPDLLPFAVESVLAQSRQDFELFIVCDGAPAETVAVAQAFAARDSRILVRAHPKGARHGEAWRHAALCAARGTFVCHLGDDDLWLPEHLEELAALLAEADFGHCLHVETHPDGRALPVMGNIAIARTREQLLREAVNLCGPTCAGYRLAAYRALPEGWAPGPAGVWSDLNMWRKFLRQPGLRFLTRYAVTAVCLPAALRPGWSPAQRVEENRRYAALIRDAGWRADYRARVLAVAAETFALWLSYAEAERAQAAEDPAPLRREIARLEAEARQQARRLGQAEAALAYVGRSRLWRLRQRLAGLLRRA